MLGFLILSRAWFGIIFVPLSLLHLHYFYMLVTIVMTSSVFILFMFFVIMFPVYFDYILSIASLSLCLSISSYSAHSSVHRVSGQHCVSVVNMVYTLFIIMFTLYSESCGRSWM